MKLRPYQDEALGRVFEELQTHPSTLVEMATGLGKTVMFAHVARRWPRGRVLVVAHREELLSQAAQKIAAITGEAADLEMGEARADERPLDRSRIIVGSVQTLCRPRRLTRFDPEQFGLAIVDECHHAVTDSYRDVLAHFRRNQSLKVLGVTATPRRADQLALGQTFESVAYQYGIEQAVRDGWLCPVRQQVITVQGLDFSQVKEIAGDFAKGELEKILTEEEPLHRVVASTVELCGDAPTLVFCVSVNHAEMVAALLNRYKRDSAVALKGDQAPAAKAERRQWVQAFREGKVQYLVNCMLFTEGFDAPSTANVVMARPTKSIVLYQQVLGRGTRTLPGVLDGLDDAPPDARRQAIAASAKPSMLALDFVGNSGRHKIVTSFDVLGGKWGTPVRQYAQKTAAQEGKAAPVEMALERAADEMELERLVAEELARRAKIKAQAEYRTQEVSPFEGGGVKVASAPVPREPATEKQVWLLHQLGIPWDVARGYSKKQAGVVIGKMKARQAG